MNAQAAPVSFAPKAPNASWPASRLIGRPVVHARVVAQVGTVADLVFSPENRQLVGLLLGSSGAEGGLLEALRRVLGADFGLRFVPIQRVISLNCDAVMIDTEPGAAPIVPDRRHLPRLGVTRGFAVITMQGQRLGRLADLQLDPDGRRIAGYVVERETAVPLHAPTAPPAAPSQPAAQATSIPVPAPALPSSRFMIPARFRVRFGHGLIITGDDLSRPVIASVPPSASGEWPAPRWAAGSAEPAPPPHESPDELAAPPDAPTEQLNA